MESQVSSSMRRPCFREEDDGLASIAGFSGVNNIHHGYPLNNNNQPSICYNNNNNGGLGNGGFTMRRRNSLRNITSLSSSIASSSSSNNVFSPRSGRFFDEVHSPHFLEACAMCNRPLGGNRDIFMYRGDTPFCSEECRQEQIEIDEAKEKNRNYKALRSKKEAKKSTATTTTSSSSPSKSQNYPFRTGTVAAA